LTEKLPMSDKFIRRVCSGGALMALAAVSVLAITNPALAETAAPGVQASHVYTTAVPPTPAPPPVIEDDRRVLRGDKLVTSGTFILRSDEILQGDLTVMGGEAILQEGSRVQGTVSVLGGSLDVYGELRGNLTQLGGTLRLRSSASVLGRLSTVGGNLQRDSGAYVAQQDADIARTGWRWNIPPFFRNLAQSFSDTVRGVFGAITGIIIITLLSIAVMALFPTNVAVIAQTARQQTLASGSIGILTYIAIPIIVAILAITICLIPAAIILVIAWVLAIVVGWASIARILGERLAVGFALRNWSPIGEMALGAAVLAALGALPIVGWLVGLAASAVGIGALLLTRAGTLAYPAPAATVPHDPAGSLPPPSV
jgi:hypothetical protein